MAVYVTLYKFTEQGMKNIGNCAQRHKENLKRWESLGGKVLGSYFTLGEFDMIAIADVPNEKAGLQFLMEQGSRGNVRTTTMRAFTSAEAEEVLQHFQKQAK